MTKNEKNTKNYKRSKEWQDRIDWVNEVKSKEAEGLQKQKRKSKGPLLLRYF